ncbi:MAG: aminopeptidase P family protein [Thaumarchaeota archaeon]|nr:aminopeptidase P family protein [Nitrososphaerota archaeon]
MQKRRQNLLKFCNKLGCNTLVAFEPENLFYMTRFWGEAIGVLDSNGTTIIAPELEVGRAKEESVDSNIVKSERGKSSLSTLIMALKGRKVCTDSNNYDVVRTLKKALPVLKSSTDPFYSARQIKDIQEIKILRQGSKILDEMFELCTNKIKEGQSEIELQSILMSFAMEREMFATGYKSTLNPLIIAGGSNGALPHAQVTKRKFSNGDMIVIDLTLRYRGYVSDATRTFALGSVSNEAKKVYEIVKESQREGLKAVKPRSSCKSVDNACRKVIEKKGYGKYFIHSTGHGIGLEVHELPSISHLSKTHLEKNMAITVEPGIYLPKKFGVRIEDSLIVKNRAEPLHKFTKDLIII